MNGIIVDPSGVAVSSSGFSSGGSSAVSGCFIGTASSESADSKSGLWNAIRGRELAIGLVFLAMLKILTIVMGRMRKRWEESQRKFDLYHERGDRFTARRSVRRCGGCALA